MYLYRSATIDRMWEILEGDSAFSAAIAQARRIKPDGDGWLKRLMFKAPADFPHVDLAQGGSFNGRPFPMSTFDQEPAQFDVQTTDWNPTASADFLLRISFRDQQQATAAYVEQIESLAICALVSSGPTLNNASGTPLSGVFTWGPYRGARSMESVNGTLRPVSRITIPVQYQLDGSDLLPD